MIKDLIKLADFLDQHQKKQMADAVDQMVENLAKDPFSLKPTKPVSPLDAPKALPISKNLGHISGEWDTKEFAEDLEPEPDDLLTDVMEPGEMAKQHKPTKGLVNAIHTMLSKWAQHPISIRWHLPGTEPGVNSHEEEGEPPYWIVIARSDDPTDVPDDNYWAMWEVTPSDEHWEIGIPIEGKQTKLYGEW